MPFFKFRRGDASPTPPAGSATQAQSVEVLRKRAKHRLIGASVLVLLGKDTRRRLKAERELADALAFRKAMEDSLLTGLRARDLAGRTTYVNPSFCQMVGFSAAELLGRGEVLAGEVEKGDSDAT